MKAALAIIATLLLGTCSQPPTVLEQIMRAGELRVVTRNLPSAYYLGASGPQGPEFDLASRFAAELAKRSSLPVELVDERWSSQDAEERLRAQRASGERKRRVTREDVDAAAAAVILERWFEQHT